jgi:hypothetical protein
VDRLIALEVAPRAGTDDGGKQVSQSESTVDYVNNSDLQ